MHYRTDHGTLGTLGTYALELDTKTPEAVHFFLHCKCLAEKSGFFFSS
jgi:hypothetical protein